MTNIEINKRHYDEQLRKINRNAIIERVRNVKAFLDDATVTDTSWVAFYEHGGSFRNHLRNARILELGAGDGLNALCMAAWGAEVVAVDISIVTPTIVDSIARELGLQSKIKALAGDFREMSFELASFDFVVGKAFLHHLEHDVEEIYVEKAAKLLRNNGECRFAEPATNSQALDKLRWMVPVPGRPSCLSTKAFHDWKMKDPHPSRENSADHFRNLGLKYFEEATIIPVGGLERFNRLLPQGRFNRRYRRFAFKVERLLPLELQMWMARTQTIIFRRPRRRAQS